MTIESVNRVPQGVPSGGQFAPTSHSESSVKLFDRNDGSYSRPSPSATAEHCIEFWSNVEVPDEIIDQVEKAYEADRYQELTEVMDNALADWTEGWVKENPAPPARKEKDTESYNERYRVDLEAYRVTIIDDARAQRPMQLGTYDCRQVIRAAQMLAHRPHPAKFPEESDKVLDHEVQLFDETLTVHGIEKKYRTSRIGNYIERIIPAGDPDEALLQGVNETNRLLSSVHEQLRRQNIDAQY